MAKRKARAVKKSKGLDGNRLGRVMAVFFSISLVLMALTAWILGWGMPLVHLLGSFYIGYEASLKGVIVGAIWGLLDGYVTGWLFAWVYNKYY